MREAQLSIPEVMELLGVSRATLLRIRRDDGSFPLPTWEKGQASWDKADVEKWRANREPRRERFRPRKVRGK